MNRSKFLIALFLFFTIASVGHQSTAQAQSSYVGVRISTGSLSNQFVRIRKSPRANGPIAATVQEFDFLLVKPHAARSDGVSWHEVKVAPDAQESLWVARIPNVYLIRGVLKFPAGYAPTLRRQASFEASSELATVPSPGAFEVIDVFEGNYGGQKIFWYKVLLKDLDKEKIAFIAGVNKGGLAPNFVETKAGYEAHFQAVNSDINYSQTCSAGRAHVGYLRSNQLVFRQPQVVADRYFIGGKNQPVTLVRGTRVRLLTAPGSRYVNVVKGFAPIELTVPEATGFKRLAAYVRRSEIKLVEECKPYAPDLLSSGMRHWGGSEYRSYSVPARATNIALALSRLDGSVLKSGTEFSFLENAVFPHEVPLRGFQASSTNQLDQMGCGPGRVFNRFAYSSIQGYCRPFLHGMSTRHEPIYAGGICGVSSLIHRSVYATGLPITRFHNHKIYYPSVYELPDITYGRKAGMGTEAEVAWSTMIGGGRDWSGYRFFNDSRSNLVIVTHIWYSQEDNVTHAVLQFWGHGSSDRSVKLYPVETIATNRQYQWQREVSYARPPLRQVFAQHSDISSFMNGLVRTDIVKTRYSAVEKY